AVRLLGEQGPRARTVALDGDAGWGQGARAREQGALVHQLERGVELEAAVVVLDGLEAADRGDILLYRVTIHLDPYDRHTGRAAPGHGGPRVARVACLGRSVERSQREGVEQWRAILRTDISLSSGAGVGDPGRSGHEAVTPPDTNERHSENGTAT